MILATAIADVLQVGGFIIGILNVIAVIYVVILAAKIGDKNRAQQEHKKEHTEMKTCIEQHRIDITQNRHDIKNILQQQLMDDAIKQETHDSVLKIEIAVGALLDKAGLNANIYFGTK